MQAPQGEVHEIQIDALRRDAALAGRGMFVLMLLPAMALMLYWKEALKNLPRFDPASLLNPRPWVLVALLVLIVVGLSRLGGCYTAAGLRFVIAALVLTPFVAIAFGLWNLPEIEWSRFATVPPHWEILIASVIAILAVIAAMLWWLIITPAAAASRLLRANVGSSGRTYVDVMSALAQSSSKSSLAPYRRSSATSRALKGIALLAAVVMVIAVVWMQSQELLLSSLVVTFAAIYVLTVLMRRARMLDAVDAEHATLDDPRAPVLYLRAFQDDAALMQAEWDVAIQSRAGSLGKSPAEEGALQRLWSRYSIGLLSTTGRLEEAIAPEARLLGPFVAIGDPNEPLPKLGAARAYFDNETWRSAVVRWVDMSQLIVKVAGLTRWVRWELDTIIDRGGLPRLVIVMPPAAPRDRILRWQNMMAELHMTPWATALAKVEPRTLVALRFNEGGSVTVVSGGKARMLDYQIGLRLLLADAAARNAH